MKNYPRNIWYVACLDEELDQHGILSRYYLNEPVVIFRSGDGKPKALQDRCPHRFAPLSKGQLTEQGLTCGYHGLSFDGTGACVHNPHGAIPKAARVKAYPLEERDRLIWIWMGDPALADPELIPDFSDVAAAAPHSFFRGYLPTACDTMLLVDNIMDLSHIDYLHANSLGSGAITKAAIQVDDLSERQTRATWLSSGDKAARFFDEHLAKRGQPTDQWTEVTWYAPTYMKLHVGATLLGEPKEKGADTLNLHLGTPEKPGHTHYWYWVTRNFAIDAEVNSIMSKAVDGIFREEDKPMLEAQQLRMGDADFWDLEPVLLKADAGALRARRKLTALLQETATA